MQTTVDNLFDLEKMEDCSCKKGKVAFICMDDKCTNKNQKLYCISCDDENKHTH
jgi:hypothetical protein